MSHENEINQPFFRRLAKDTTANTIAISAASLVPIMAMVGGGVDASRYYMAETRLQAACDAGALAARRAMDDSNFTAEHKTIGENFFDQNYEDGLFGTKGLSRAYVGTDDGEVKGTASGTLPTSLMGAFGYEQFSLSVDCKADINISNTDIMFVVDVTGSMGWRPDGTSCSGGCGSASRLQGLRDAVMTFYDTVDGSTSSSAQVRYGMVPYSTNANVGAELMAQNPDWLAKEHTYQSREGENYLDFDDYEEISTDYLRTGGAYNIWKDGNRNKNINGVPEAACPALIAAEEEEDILRNPREWTWTLQSQTGTNPRTSVYRGQVEYRRFVDVGNSEWVNKKGGRCKIRLDRQRYRAETEITVVEEPEEKFRYIYRPVTYDLTTLYDDDRIELPTGWNFANQNVDWDGCVEEASTVTGSDFDPIPDAANDLKINLTPSNADEYWKPVLRNAVWRRTDGDGRTLNELRQTWNEQRPFYTCPREAFRLEDISRGDLKSYVDSLQASGNTYHDVGMIWGARFVSPNGIFAAQNAAAPNGDAIARHIVFMTDGELAPNIDQYNMYGVEWWDRRITGNGNSNTARTNHAARFQAACRAARQENISVWVVAFGTSLTQNLIDCATPGRAFAASNSAELDERFKEIAQQIAALRLTQ